MDAWIIQRFLGEIPDRVMAVCASHELALKTRDAIRAANPRITGRLVVKMFQMVENETHSDTVARRLAE